LTKSNLLGSCTFTIDLMVIQVTSGFKEEFKLMLAGGDGALSQSSLLSVDYRVPSSHFAKQRDCKVSEPSVRVELCANNTTE